MKNPLATFSPLIKIALPAVAAAGLAMVGGGVQSRTASRASRNPAPVAASTAPVAAPPPHDPLFAFSSPAPRHAVDQPTKHAAGGEESWAGGYPWRGHTAGRSSGALLDRLNEKVGLLGKPGLATYHCDIGGAYSCQSGPKVNSTCNCDSGCASSCNPGGGNTPPTFTGGHNTGLTVLEDAAITLITTAMLQVKDAEQAAAALTYTVGTAPTKGVLSNNGSTVSASGTFTQADIDGNKIKYTPSANLNGADSFTFSVSDGASGSLSGQTFSITITVVNDAPTLTGATAGQAVDDNATISPFSGVTIGDAETSQTQAVSVTLDTAAKGSFTTLNGFADAGSGVYTYSGTAAAATTAIRGLVLTPTANRVAPGSTETTTFTISTNDGVASAVTNSTTTVVSTSVNNSPAFVTGSTATFTVAGNSSDTDISGYLPTTDADTGQTLTYTVSAATNHGGVVTAGTTATSGAGSRTPTGWYYRPATGYSGTETFTLRVSDGTATATRAFSVTVDAANVAPAFVGATTSLTVAQSAPATDLKSLLHVSDSDSGQTETWTTSTAPSHGTLTVTGATASSGTTDITPGGTLTYAPTAGYAGADSFTIQVSDGTASATRTINVTVSAPTLIFALDDGNGSSYGGYHLAGYNTTTGKYSIIANPNPVGFDGFNSALYLYSGKIYTLAMDASNSPTGKLARFNGTDFEYIGTNTFSSIKQFTEFNGKLYFIGTNIDASYTETSYLYYFDSSNSTITQVTSGTNSAIGTTVLTMYGSAIYYWGNTASKSNVMLKWDGTTLAEVQFGGNNLVDVRGPTVEVSGILYFWSKAGTETDYSIFKLNGTTLTRFYGPMAADNAPWDFVPYNNKLFFNLAAPGCNGSYSVRSVDLTTAAMTIEHAPTLYGSMNYQIFGAAGNLYFLYYPNDGTGWNLYKYNSTNNITKVTSLNTVQTYLENLTADGTNIYFSADPTSAGLQELYKYDTVGGSVTKVSSFNPSTDPATLTFSHMNGSPTSFALTGLIKYTVPLAPFIDYVRDVRGAVASGGAVSVAPNLQVRDIDGTHLTGATVSIVSGYSAGDTLSFTTGSGITGSYSAGTLTLGGTATVANYETVLRTVAFAPNATAGERQIHFRATDTEAQTSSSTALSARAIIEVTNTTGHVDTLDFVSLPTGLSTTAYASTFSISDSMLGNIVFKTTDDLLTTAKASLTGSSSGTTSGTDGTEHGFLYDTIAKTVNIVPDSNAYATPNYLAIYSSNGSAFDFQGFSIDDSEISYWNTTKVQITGFRSGVQVAQEDYYVTSAGRTKIILSSNFNSVDEVRIGNPAGAYGIAVSGKFSNFVILAKESVAANVAPAFVGATTTLTVAQSASATDLKSLLHVSDSDSGQTETWTQSTAPSHGTLTMTGATASSGTTDITPGGTLTYAPTAGYAGADSFTVQASDGTASATRTISVTVSAPTVTVSALTLNSMTAGTLFTSQSFSGAGGIGAYTYSVSAGALPGGLALDASTGALTGTPTTAGAYSFTIRATDSSTGTSAPFNGTLSFSGSVAAAAVAGTCDSSSDGQTLTGAPSALCASGSASSVTSGNTLYTWTCAGSGTPASCSATRHYLVAPSAGANGSLAPSSAQSVAYNATPSFTVSPGSGHDLQSVSGCAGTLSGSSYTTGAISADCTVAARFSYRVRLNDTGASNCYDGSGLAACAAANTGNAATHPRQDGRFGRDAAQAAGQLAAKTGGGAAGFDFTPLDASGAALALTGAPPVPSAPPACTRDNVTGLLWEVKTAANKNTWYNLAGAAAYASAANSASLCGASSGWRLPSRRELLSLVHHGASNPAIDPAYFPHTESDRFWTSDIFVPDPAKVWYVYFDYGYTSAESESVGSHVRLVRSGP